MIKQDLQVQLVSETTVGPGTTTREDNIQSDSLIATLWVNSISSGTLTVSVYTLTDTGKELLLFSFPVLSAPSASLLLKKAGISMARFIVRATYTGICSYEIYVKATQGAGESSVKIVGAATLKASQITVGTSPTLLVPVSLTDRNGIIIKNWNTNGALYVADAAGDDTVGNAYPIAPGEALSVDIASGVAFYGVAASGTVDVRILEAGG